MTTADEVDRFDLYKDHFLMFADVESPIGIHAYNHHNRSIILRLTRKAAKTQKTMFPEDRFPAFLGKPVMAKLSQASLESGVLILNGYKDDKSGDIEKEHFYCWDNDIRTFGTATGRHAAVFRFSFTKDLKYTRKCEEYINPQENKK